MLTRVNNLSAVSAGNTLASSGTVVFSNSNNVSFGMNGNTVTASASAAAQTNQSAIKAFGASNTGNTAGNTGVSTGVDWVVAGTNGVTVSESTAAGGPNTLWLSAGGGNFSAGASNVGNTSGNTGVTGTRLVFAGGNNITVSQGTDANGATLTISGANAGGAQTGISGVVVSNTTYTSGTVSFSNANGASFGSSAGQAITLSYTVPVVTNSSLTMQAGGSTLSSVSRVAFVDSNGVSFGASTSNNGSITITATVATNYQSQGAYLTTADLSANSSDYFRNWKLTGNTAGTTSSKQGTDFWLAGGNGVTVSGSSNTISFSVATNYQSQGAYLTTAALSGDTSKYLENWKLTGNTAGTTSSAQGTDLWLAGGNGITVSGSSNTISFSVGNYITTADLSANSSKYVQNWKLTGNTAGTTSSAQGTDLWFGGGNGITVSGSSNTISFSVGAYLTTAALSGDTSKYVQAWELTGNTAGTTSSAQGTKLYFSGGANVTVSGNSNTIVISAAAGAGGNFSGGVSTGGNTAGNTGITGTQLVFVGTNMISLSQTTGANGGTVSINATQSVQTLGIYGAGNTSGTSSATIDARTLSINASGALSVAASSSGWNLSVPATSSLSATGLVQISTNGSTISIGVPGAMQSYFAPYPLAFNTVVAFPSGSTSQVAQFCLPYEISPSFLRLPINLTTNSTTLSTSNAALNGSASVVTTWNAVVYSMGKGASSQSLVSIASGSVLWGVQHSISATGGGTQYSISQSIFGAVEGVNFTSSTQYSASTSNYSFTTGSIFTNFSGTRFLDINFTQSLAPGAYWLIVGWSTNSASNSARVSAATNCNLGYSQVYGNTGSNIAFAVMGSTNQTTGNMVGAGSFSTAGGGTTSILPISAITSTASHFVPFFQMIGSQ